MLGALPLSMTAQDDDMYFVPSKKNVERERVSYSAPSNSYYSGSSRSVDEYNRRSGSYYETLPSDTGDIVTFSAIEGVYPDSVGDFQITRQMSRWDGYEPATDYWAGYPRGLSDSFYSWHSPWYYSSFYPWYDSWYYDPWYYSSWHYGWYDPWYRPYYSWHWGGYYSSWYYPYHWGGVGYVHNWRHGRYIDSHNVAHGSSYGGSSRFGSRGYVTGSRGYAAGNRRTTGGTYAAGTTGKRGTSTGVTGSRRYGTTTNGGTVYSPRSTGSRGTVTSSEGSRYSGTTNTGTTTTSSYNYGGNRSSSSSGSYSGGGSRSGGGSFSSGGGSRSGGGGGGGSRSGGGRR